MNYFQKVMKDAKRMYTAQGDENHPIYLGEIDFEEFERTVEQYAHDNPVQTNRMALRAVFPNLTDEGVCPRHYGEGISVQECKKRNCNECARNWLDAEYIKGGVFNE